MHADPSLELDPPLAEALRALEAERKLADARWHKKLGMPSTRPIPEDIQIEMQQAFRRIGEDARAQRWDEAVAAAELLCELESECSNGTIWQELLILSQEAAEIAHS